MVLGGGEGQSLTVTQVRKAGLGCGSVVDHWPTMPEAQGSISSSTKQKHKCRALVWVTAMPALPALLQLPNQCQDCGDFQGKD